MCALCGETFDKSRTDEEAQAEAEEVFGADLGEAVLVCDDCFEAMNTLLPITEWRRRIHAWEN